MNGAINADMAKQTAITRQASAKAWTCAAASHGFLSAAVWANIGSGRIDRLAGGLSDTGKRLSAEDGERIVRVVAHHVGAEVHPRSPRLSAELPQTGERLEGLIPPIVAAPAFAIRKHAVAIFTLAGYACAGIMTAQQAELLCGMGCSLLEVLSGLRWVQ